MFNFSVHPLHDIRGKGNEPLWRATYGFEMGEKVETCLVIFTSLFFLTASKNGH